jgi:hypothetical protein
MATLTIKNVPDELYKTISELAKKNRRSLNSQAIVQLEQSVRKPTVDVEETIRRARDLRAKYPAAWLSQEDVDRAKNEGRP